MSDEITLLEKAYVSVGTLGGAIMTIIGWVWHRNERRAEKHDARIAKLELDVAQKVSHAENREMFEVLRSEIKESGRNMQEAVTKVHERVDDTYKLIAKQS